MTIDAAGDLYAAASTGVEAIQPKNAVVADVTTGGYFLELDPSGVPLQTSAFGGHIVDEAPAGIALDPAGNIYIAGGMAGSGNPFVPGCTQNDPIIVGSDIYGPTSNSSNPCYGTGGIFVSKIAPDAKPQISLSQYLPFLYLHNVGSADLNISSINFSGGLAKAGGTCGSKVPAGTTTVLALTTSSGTATTVVQGTVVTLTATVTPASGAIKAGQVNV